ncbi:CHAT domain-containing protein [Streptomyces radicis]|uniref:CHAT domain-containing protein n=2 Tax=Streptomyces radicis TaxID=1750517 RepID=A0A3A9WGN5_9ACTN|nr:CHAT domain-containing protein [Streptomyces radicis]RKN21742.1 CHAT domain-containing protein [Streptomyces radicis]
MRGFLGADRAAERTAERTAERAAHRTADRVAERPAERSAEPPPPPSAFEARPAGLADALPPDVALLRVTATSRGGHEQLTLSWHHGGTMRTAPDERLSVQGPLSELSLAALVARAAAESEGKHPWRAAYYDVMNWWLPETRLGEWLRELLAAAGQPRLVVWDNTPYDIPWELLYHQPARPTGRDGDAAEDTQDTVPERQGWLGELIPVVRWVSVYDGARARAYSAERHVGEGGVLMLEDERFTDGRDDFGRYLVEPPTRTVQALMHRLDQPVEPFGLLLIRCHGVHSPMSRHFSLGGLSLNEYTDFPMTALDVHRAPVLLNACSSGRTVRDPRRPDAAARGFPELFLRRGASAVIATVGDIDLNHSHDFALRLLHEAEEAPTRFADALHRHRGHYARRARRTPGAEDRRGEADFKLFLHSFLYVYYGHPDSSLRVVAREAP